MGEKLASAIISAIAQALSVVNTTIRTWWGKKKKERTDIRLAKKSSSMTTIMRATKQNKTQQSPTNTGQVWGKKGSTHDPKHTSSAVKHNRVHLSLLVVFKSLMKSNFSEN